MRLKVRYPQPFAYFTPTRTFVSQCMICHMTIAPSSPSYYIAGIGESGYVHPSCLPRGVYVVRPEDAWSLAVDLWSLQELLEIIVEELKRLSLFLPEVESVCQKVQRCIEIRFEGGEV